MKRQLTILAGAALALSVSAQNSPLWTRYCAISPDGNTIAFCYQGDIYTVPAQGGKATPLTTNPSYDTHPVWSPDGTRIAFASDRQGSFDIYLSDKVGGIPKRLTTHSGKEIPVAFSDNGHLLFEAALMPESESVIFPSSQFSQIYEVSTDGGRPTLFSSFPMKDISVGNDGTTLLYHDQKGYEDPWRKHHTSSITRDVWMSRTENGGRTYTKLTDFNRLPKKLAANQTPINIDMNLAGANLDTMDNPTGERHSSPTTPHIRYAFSAWPETVHCATATTERSIP